MDVDYTKEIEWVEDGSKPFTPIEMVGTTPRPPRKGYEYVLRSGIGTFVFANKNGNLCWPNAAPLTLRVRNKKPPEWWRAVVCHAAGSLNLAPHANGSDNLDEARRYYPDAVAYLEVNSLTIVKNTKED